MSELPRAEAEVEFSPIRGGPYYEGPRVCSRWALPLSQELS